MIWPKVSVEPEKNTEPNWTTETQSTDKQERGGGVHRKEKSSKVRGGLGIRAVSEQ